MAQKLVLFLGGPSYLPPEHPLCAIVRRTALLLQQQGFILTSSAARAEGEGELSAIVVFPGGLETLRDLIDFLA